MLLLREVLCCTLPQHSLVHGPFQVNRSPDKQNANPQTRTCNVSLLQYNRGGDFFFFRGCLVCHSLWNGGKGDWKKK